MGSESTYTYAGTPDNLSRHHHDRKGVRTTHSHELGHSLHNHPEGSNDMTPEELRHHMEVYHFWPDDRGRVESIDEWLPSEHTRHHSTYGPGIRIRHNHDDVESNLTEFLSPFIGHGRQSTIPPDYKQLARWLQSGVSSPVGPLKARLLIEGTKALRDATKAGKVEYSTYYLTRSIVRDALLDIDVELDEHMDEELV